MSDLQSIDIEVQNKKSKYYFDILEIVQKINIKFLSEIFLIF